MSKAHVSIRKTHAQNYQKGLAKDLRTTLDDIGALEYLHSKGNRILIKPNIASPEAIYSVSPAVLFALTKILVDEGFHVSIGENPSIPTDADKAYRDYGLYEIADEAGAEVLDFRRGPHVEVDVPGGKLFHKLTVSKFVLDADAVISLATMKSANIVTATLAVKNMKGCIPSHYKRKFHCEGLNDGICDLMKVVKPDLAIIDCTFGKDMTSKCCFPVGLLIASTDVLAADSICARIMGYNPNEIEHFRQVSEAGLGKLDLSDIEVLGEKLEDHIARYPFSKPMDPIKIAKQSGGNLNIIQGNPCSVCLNELGTVLHLFQNRISELDDVTLLVGPNAVADTDDSDDSVVIGFGNCVSQGKCTHHIAGCPPTDYRAAETGSLIDVFQTILGDKET
jgi:uncharacterized protein (DUF362 family)